MNARQERQQMARWLAEREQGRVKKIPDTHSLRKANRKKALNVARVIRWQQRHRCHYNALMRKYRKRIKIKKGLELA